MKAECKDCKMCVPREDLYNQKQWKFPEETECLPGKLLYPHYAYLCDSFILKDSKDK